MVHMTRKSPEVENGPVAIDVPEKDVPVLEKRGWIAVKGKEEKKPEPVKEEVPQVEAEEKPVKSEKKNKF